MYQSARAPVLRDHRDAAAGARGLPAAIVGASANDFRNRRRRKTSPGKFDYTSKGYAVTLSQPIFRMQNWIAISQAEKVVLQAEATLAGAAAGSRASAWRRPTSTCSSRRTTWRSRGSQKVAISEQLAQAKRNFEVGTATIVDTLEAQARYDQADAKEISDKNDLEVKRRALAVLVGKLPEGLTPLREPLALAPPKPNDIEAWVTAASDSSVAIVNRARERGHRQAGDRSPARRATCPRSICPRATRARTTRRTSFRVSSAPSRTPAPWACTLCVPDLPGRPHASRACARPSPTATGPSRTSRTRAARCAQSVRTNFLNVTRGIAQVRALEQALTSTQSQLDSTILGRDVGVRTSVDVLNAQQQVFQTRRDLQQARYNYLLSTLRLKAAAGTLTETDVEEVNRTLGDS